MTIEVVPAEAGEIDVVLGLLDDAARWLLAKNIDQWRPGQWKREKIAAAISRGDVRLARRDGALVGTISLQWSDDEVWPEGGDDAGYVHRLAVGDGAHGEGVGRMLLDWAGREFAVRRRSFVRLDCACENSGLRGYYERLGFAHRGDRPIGRFCASRYEKRVTA